MSLLISLITLLFGLFLIFYASHKISGFDLIDVYVKGLIVIFEGLIFSVATSIFIVIQELNKKENKLKSFLKQKCIEQCTHKKRELRTRNILK